MSRKCELTGKRPRSGHKTTTRGMAKYKGGVGTKVTGITKRFFYPNIQKVRALVDGGIKRVRVSTRALRNGMIQKPGPRPTDFEPSKEKAELRKIYKPHRAKVMEKRGLEAASSGDHARARWLLEEAVRLRNLYNQKVPEKVKTTMREVGATSLD